MHLIRYLLALMALLVGASADAQGFGKDQPFDFSTPQGPPPNGAVTLRAIPSKQKVAPGEELVIAVQFDIHPGWHTWPAGEPVRVPELEDWQSIPTELRIDADGIARVGPVQWPEAHPIATGAIAPGKVVEIPMYEGRQVAFVPLIISPDAPLGEATIGVEFYYQACDDSMCDRPRTATAKVPIEIIASPLPAPSIPDDPIFAAFDQRVFSRQSQWTDGPPSQAPRQTARPDFLGIPLPDNAGIIALALASAVGGLVLNLTPCVLPVIPIKIMAISQHAGSAGKSLRLGIWMALGVVAFWVALAVPVLFLRSAVENTFTDPSRLIFGTWWVTLTIGVLIFAMGLGIMGLFTITLPQKVYMLNPRADSPFGSFLFGVMTAILGLPCFGFVAGALLAGAATLPASHIVTIFTSLGIGMALPYLVLSARPQWVEKIPRTGPASELVKQVMGLLLLAASAFFIGAGVIALVQHTVDDPSGLPWWWKQVHWWLVALFAASAGLWLAWRTFRITRRAWVRTVSALIALVLVGVSGAWATAQTIEARENFWIPYTPEALEQGLREGKIVVIDFTAEWCLNCKALAVILNSSPVREELLKGDVLPLLADNTVDSAPGWELMSELGQTGIPLLVVYGPALDQPWQANSYTAQTVLDAIRRARGGEAGPDDAHEDSGTPDG